jgi:hypothetical protein
MIVAIFLGTSLDRFALRFRAVLWTAAQHGSLDRRPQFLAGAALTPAEAATALAARPTAGMPLCQEPPRRSMFTAL